jgi:hypothetical protein
MSSSKFKPAIIQILIIAIIALQIICIYSSLKQAREDFHEKEKNWAIHK